MATTDLPPVETDPAPTPGSALAAARARRRLTVEEAAARADLDPDTVRALEEGRVYRFETPQDAIAAVIVYANGLGISKREARELVGLPVRPRLLERGRLRRFLAALVFLGAVGAAVWFGVTSSGGAVDAAPPAATARPRRPRRQPPRSPSAGRSRSTSTTARTARERRLAARERDRRSRLPDRRGHGRRPAELPETRVYYPPGGEAVGASAWRDELGVEATALPGGDDPNRLVVIVGATLSRRAGRAAASSRRSACGGRASFALSPSGIASSQAWRTYVPQAPRSGSASRQYPQASRCPRPRRRSSGVELAVEVGLEQLLALLARSARTRASLRLPDRRDSASSPLRMRRPRCRRDMTVPIGMSRICAASW